MHIYLGPGKYYLDIMQPKRLININGANAKHHTKHHVFWKKLQLNAHKSARKNIYKTSGYAMVVHGRPKTPKNTVFWGHPTPRGRTAPIF